jgi:hypothetical protein
MESIFNYAPSDIPDDRARVAGPGELEGDELDPTPDASPSTGTDTFFTTTAGSDTTLSYQWSENANGMVLNIKGICKGQEDGASLGVGSSSSTTLPRTGAYAPEATCKHGVHPYDCRDGCDPHDAPFDSFERRDRLNDKEWEEGK